MHGRPRKPPTDEEQVSSCCKASKLRDLQLQVLNFHQNKIFTKEALETSAKLLESNPEHYTGWNFRKLAVQFILDQLSSNGDDTEAIRSILNEELKVVESALRTNVKSYGAWYHRKWVLSKGYSSTDRELRLLDMFCKLDSRNFHMWNYRRFITALRKIPDNEEFNYTTDVIEDNFSNYSAWHNRSVLLSKLMEKNISGYDVEENLLKDEYDFVRNALFTDPDDQSGWFYHLWLLDQTLKCKPVLLSSWPPQGSSFRLGHDAFMHVQQSDLALHFQSRAMLPVILYFSEAVNGVGPSTVSVECEYHTFNDLSFRPLSEDTSGFSPAWMTYLEFPDKVNSVEAYSVKLTVAHFPGITSSSGMPVGQSCHMSFTVTVPSGDQVHTEIDDSYHRISWREENFTAFTEENFTNHLRNKEVSKRNDQTSNWRMEIISNEIAHCQELLLSTECKIGKLTLARLLMARNILISYGNTNDGTEVQYEDILKLYHDLKKMDPAHTCYYQDEYSLVLLNQVISDTESLANRCAQYRELSSPSLNRYSSLRLNSLSLSRIGCIENFLWVQMLDLSCNELHTIEGLEALQLLSCLKLSHNKFNSFTALQPLKMLISLVVLDISHNEIGSHSIDTRRYLSSSPLNHAVKIEWSSDAGDDKLKDRLLHWDAYLLFKDMNLVQLDIAGNQVADDRLRTFLVEVIPTLKWLDGEKCH